MYTVDRILVFTLQLRGQGQENLQQDIGLGDCFAGSVNLLSFRVKDLFSQFVIHYQTYGDSIILFLRDLVHIVGDGQIAHLLFVGSKGKFYLAAANNCGMIGLGVYRIVGFLMKYGIQIAHHDVGAAGSHFHDGVCSAFRQGGVAGLVFGQLHFDGNGAHVLGDHQIVDTGNQVCKFVCSVLVCGGLINFVCSQPQADCGPSYHRTVCSFGFFGDRTAYLEHLLPLGRKGHRPVGHGEAVSGLVSLAVVQPAGKLDVVLGKATCRQGENAAPHRFCRGHAARCSLAAGKGHGV